MDNRIAVSTTIDATIEEVWRCWTEPEHVKKWNNASRAAGGLIFAEPEENQGWMYGSGFADPDGHRWNILFMDKPTG